MSQRQLSRRGYLRTTAGGMGMLAASAASVHSAPQPLNTQQTALTLAGYSYDRVRAIQDGRLQLDGFDIQFQPDNIYSLNRKLFGPAKTYEVSETGLIPFVTRFANQDFRGYKLIPVFISRLFRHRNIFVRTDGGIEKPEDLRGKRVATPGYGMSSHTWIRGFLQDVYGVRPDEMQWIETTKSSDGGEWDSDFTRYYLPDDFPIEKGPPNTDESQMLLDGQADALVTAIEPKAFVEGHPKVRRLFPNIRAVEQEYYKTTRVFPIMHVVAVRDDIAEKYPQLPAKLFKLYSQSKQSAYDDLRSGGALKVTLPWLNQEWEETCSIMGNNYWPYGIAANRKELELVMRYTHEQGLTKRRVAIEEIFHPSTMELVETVS